MLAAQENVPRGTFFWRQRDGGAVVAVRHCGAELSSSLERRRRQRQPSGCGGATFFRGKAVQFRSWAAQRADLSDGGRDRDCGRCEEKRGGRGCQEGRSVAAAEKMFHVEHFRQADSSKRHAKSEVRGNPAAKVRGAPEHPRSAVPFRIECSSHHPARRRVTDNVPRGTFPAEWTIAAMRDDRSEEEATTKKCSTWNIFLVNPTLPPSIPTAGLSRAAAINQIPPLLIREQELSQPSGIADVPRGTFFEIPTAIHPSNQD